MLICLFEENKIQEKKEKRKIEATCERGVQEMWKMKVKRMEDIFETPSCSRMQREGQHLRNKKAKKSDGIVFLRRFRIVAGSKGNWLLTSRQADVSIAPELVRNLRQALEEIL